MGDLQPGQVLDGRFVLQALIGKGGQGQVYRLRHLEWDRDFALKVPLPKVVQDKRSRELYLKEAESWIRLGVHPNIVRCWFVQPIGELPGLFLDLLSGGSLKSKMDQGAVVPGQWERIIQILLQIVEGLVHAHSKGMVHRDLKPENLMIHGDGRVCITDFGLVKTLGSAELDPGLEGPLPCNSGVTAGAMGTPRYGAPEQWLNPLSVDETTDLYSLGVIMFELLCGQRPFDPPDLGSTPIQIIERHIGQEPPHPCSLREDIPPALAALCLRLLSKHQAQRPHSAEAVLTELSEGLYNLSGHRYQRPSPVPGGERPDLLNNAAASLYSLGKSEKARELLLKGLMLEAGHPQCLYNLVQLDLREGKLTRKEALLRLERARADFGVALLHIECGHGREAVDFLSRIPEDEKSGYLHRLEGDAAMYAGDFDAAVQSYQKAAQRMPNDLPTRQRQKMAQERTTVADGHVYFPPLGSRHRNRHHRLSVKIALSPHSDTLLAMDESEVLGLPLERDGVLRQAKRELYSTPVVWSDAEDQILLLQDRSAFEIWDLKRWQQLARTEGRVVARDVKLSRLLAQTSEGFFLLELAHQRATPLTFAKGLELSSQTLAAFTYDQNGLGLLTSDGRLSALNASFQVIPLSWPPSVDNPAESRQLCLGRDLVAVSYRNSLVRCYNLGERRISAQVELGFLPETLSFDASGQLLVASSPLEHAVLDQDGQTLLRGKGPCSLDSDGKRCLLWREPYLRLYQLNPFRHLRTWEESVAKPILIQVARDGRCALSQDEEGEYRIWQLDEDYRVFERQLLITQGQSYPELINSYESYLQHYQEALAFKNGGLLYDSYQALRRARSVSGFQQSEEALDLQWKLCSELKREGLEAVWERLYIPDVVSAQFTSDGSRLLLAKADMLELFEISGPRIESKLVIRPGYQPVAAHLLKQKGGGDLILLLGLEGDFGYYLVESGEVQFQDRLKTGRISKVQFHGESALIQTVSGQAFTLGLGSGRMSEALPLWERSLKDAFILEDEKALIITHQGYLMACLKKNTTSLNGPAHEDALTSEVTFCADVPDSKVRMLGFQDGGLSWTHQRSGRSLFSFQPTGNPIISAAMNLETALGVCVDNAGEIHLFDLGQGRPLDRFVAHEDGITHLSMTCNGRYFTTRSRSGQFRLWEVSWLLSEKEGRSEVEWFPGSVMGRIGKFFGLG